MRWRDLLRRRGGAPGRRGAVPGRLIDCERCGSAFVNPVAWHALGETGWWIRLRCGECGLVREVGVSDELAVRYDAELDRGVTEIAREVERLARDGTEAERAE